MLFYNLDKTSIYIWGNVRSVVQIGFIRTYNEYD